jgi:type I restriction enzyme R subunit
VKRVVRQLLAKLKTELLVSDWKQRESTRAAVQVAIEDTLDQGLPDVYDRALFSRKSAAVFEHVFSAYQGAGRSIYQEAA